jgi:beta-1,4-mannosyl-glycoprotein beta-1,4-N-acetylglucosaminyltransferase
VYTFYQNFYYYNTKCRNTEKWCGTVVFSNSTNLLKLGFQGIRNIKDYFVRIGTDGNFNSGGWHFSYCGDTEYIINKLKSFAHSGFDTPKYTDPETIQKCILEGKDLLFRGDEKFEVVENQLYLPKYVKMLE